MLDTKLHSLQNLLCSYRSHKLARVLLQVHEGNSFISQAEINQLFSEQLKEAYGQFTTGSLTV